MFHREDFKNNVICGNFRVYLLTKYACYVPLHDLTLKF